MSASRDDFFALEHVSVMRGDSLVLRDINLRIGHAEKIAILGPNGCGKSTLIKVMTSELYPLAMPEMRLEIFGRARWDVTALRRRMGVVTCETPSASALATCAFDVVLTGFFSSATLWPNLAVTPMMREKAAKALEHVDASALAERPLGTLSAGQQKRVLIARALVGSASVQSGRMLLLDEPSNALDLASQAELRHTMRRLAQDTGFILVTHHIADVVPEIERVLFMREGSIVGDGTRTEMLTELKLGELFGVKVNLAERDGFLHAW